MPEQSNGSFAIRIEENDIGKRLDTFITTFFPHLSRSFISQLIRKGDITVSGKLKKPGYKVNVGDLISGIIQEADSHYQFEPQSVALDILFEDNLFLVINKKSGIVVHPAPGHDHGTLAHGLIYHRPQIHGVGAEPTRPGIVHRLDKDTSGVLVVAKTESAYKYLVSQFKKRLVSKKYLGIVFGVPDAESGRIVLNIGRHASQRKKMTVTDRENSRYAETHWRIKKIYDRLCLMEFDIKTGRTHQIRVHCAAIRHPIVGDPTYGLKKPHKLFADSPVLQKVISTVSRQMLHAWQLRLLHPESNEIMQFEAPLPQDMISLLKDFDEHQSRE